MNHYKSNAPRISGHDYYNIERTARQSYNIIARQTKRQPYIRSKYFKNSKIFIKPFWEHLFQKSPGDRKRRLRYYNCAIDLLRNTTHAPETKPSPKSKQEILHRFYGITNNQEQFIVQVKENTRTNTKTFMSIFPKNMK